jgi:hypothetical protein
VARRSTRNLQENLTTGLASANLVYTIVMYPGGGLVREGALPLRAGGNPALFFDNLQTVRGE